MIRTQFGTKRPRRCCICKTNEVANKFAKLCVQEECVITYANQERDKRLKKEAAKIAKADREDTKIRREKLKSRSDWLRECQVEFNKGIRLRDQLAGHWCISCDTSNRNVKMNAGHFLSVGAHPELRFEPLNVHLQCEKCNTHLSGNISAYRPRLIERIGIDKVDWLEGRHDPKKYTIDDLKQMKKDFREWGKSLQSKMVD